MNLQQMVNSAAFIDNKGGRVSVRTCELVQPGPGQLLLQNQAWAINPIDWKIQRLGVMVEKYPATLGFDIAGEVVAVGVGMDKFKVGDRVIAHPLGLQTKRSAEDGFQLYTILQPFATVKIPASMRYAEGVKLPLGVLTASAALYSKGHLHLPLPEISREDTGKTLLVWGGSSNVGIAAIQLAVASGVQVVAVASHKNSDLLLEAGASAIFDHNEGEVVEKVTKYLRGKDVIGAFDAIGSEEATLATGEVLATLGGGKLRSVFNRFAGLKETIDAKQVQAVSVFFSEPDVGRAVWEDFLPEALERGQIKPLLKTAVAGRGLESIQAGMDMVEAGVSGTKVVVVA